MNQIDWEKKGKKFEEERKRVEMKVVGFWI
jgi:hypothetical protein